MYGGRPGYGGQLPYSLGERSNAPFNLAGVEPSGYGDYLGDIFSDIARIADRVGMASSELSKVSSGQATIAMVPRGYASVTIPMSGSPVSKAIPLWMIGVGAAGLLYFAFRRR